MSKVHDLLDQIRSEIAPSKETLDDARDNRYAVLDEAATYPGASRTYRSGSIAHGTANDDTDADGGVVLDRRQWPDLGPDGDGVGPTDVVKKVRVAVRDALRADEIELSTRLSKRAIVFNFEYGPSVDLIVALTRKDEPGLWIPNLDRDDWDASHPERHTELLTGNPKALRVTRARAIRLVKAWNNQKSQPAVCSFNIEALALSAVESGMGLPDAVLATAEYAAEDLAKRRTPDPAGVSAPIKTLIDRDLAVARFSQLATAMDKAIASEDEDEIQDLLAGVFPNFLDPANPRSAASLSTALRGGNDGVQYTAGGLVAAGAATAKVTRSFGDR